MRSRHGRTFTPHRLSSARAPADVDPQRGAAYFSLDYTHAPREHPLLLQWAEAVVMDRHECNVVRVLRDARALIGPEQNWLTSGYAEDATGRWRPVGTPEAQRFSLVGALVRASRGCRACMAAARQVMREASPELYERYFGERSGTNARHDDALVLFDAALAWIEDRTHHLESSTRV